MDVAALTKWDTNQDGLITKTELMMSLCRAGLPYDKSARHANDFFSIADRANGGSVSLQSFIIEYTRMSNFSKCQMTGCCLYIYIFHALTCHIHYRNGLFHRQKHANGRQ
jgi:hypothetical protein